MIPVTPPSGASQPGESVTIEDAAAGSGEFNNNYQRFADSAGKQMEEAADAIRRGEFVRDAVVDPAADSDDRLVGLLNYVVPVLLPAIVLISESSEKRPFQRFHAVQSLGLSAAMILVGIAVGLVSMFLGVIPVINIIAAIARLLPDADSLPDGGCGCGLLRSAGLPGQALHDSRRDELPD